jgi:hypothetical protein
VSAAARKKAAPRKRAGATPAPAPARTARFAIVDAIGRQRIAGKFSEQTLAGQVFVRVDVPAEWQVEGVTRMFKPDAIVSITPVNEAQARLAAQSLNVRQYAAPAEFDVPSQRPRTVISSDWDGNSPP